MDALEFLAGPLEQDQRTPKRSRSQSARPGEGSRLLGGLLALLGALLGRLALRSALLRDFRCLLGSGFLSGLGTGLLCSHFRLPPSIRTVVRMTANPRVCCKTYIATY